MSSVYWLLTGLGSSSVFRLAASHPVICSQQQEEKKEEQKEEEKKGSGAEMCFDEL